MAQTGDFAYSSEEKKTSTPWAIVALVFLVAAFAASAVTIVALDRSEMTYRTLLVHIALGGAMGSSQRGAVSITSFIGHRQFDAKWLPYYFLTPLIGATLAVVVLVVLHSLLVSDVPASAFNYGGVLVLAFLAGFASGNVIAASTTTLERVVFAPQSDKLRDTQLDAYHGFLVRRIEQVEQGSVLEVWLQDRPHDMLPSVEIDTGRGLPARQVTFQVTVYADELAVSPSSGELTIGMAVVDRPPLRFTFTGEGASTPGAYLDVSQRGHTVAIVRIGSVRDGADTVDA
jgi:hypothetical protein